MEHPVNNKAAGLRCCNYPARSAMAEAGISLIEILIATVLVAVTALMIGSFSRNTMNVSADARAMDAAYLAGEQKLIELSVKTFPDAAGTDTAYIDSVRCIRTWTIDNAGYINRGIVSVAWQTSKGSRQIMLAGAIP